MPLAIIFAVYASVLAGAGVALGGHSVWLFWPAASCALLAFAYGARRAPVLGKRPDGTMSPAAVIVLLPWLVVQYAVFHIVRRVGSEPASNRVTPGLVVSRRLLAAEVPGDVRSIVDLTSEFAEPHGVRTHAGYRCAPWLDATAPSDDDLDAVVLAVANAPAPALIHCAQGHGRSALVAACILLVHEDAETAAGAIGRVVAARPRARLNREQSAALARFETRLRAGRSIRDSRPVAEAT